jgi:hypothetical protein
MNIFLFFFLLRGKRRKEEKRMLMIDQWLIREPFQAFQ